VTHLLTKIVVLFRNKRFKICTSESGFSCSVLVVIFIFFKYLFLAALSGKFPWCKMFYDQLNRRGLEGKIGNLLTSRLLQGRARNWWLQDNEAKYVELKILIQPLTQTQF